MFTTLETYDTQLSADSVEWCPIEGFHDIFVCGTYQLSSSEEQKCKSTVKSKPQIRHGRILLFQVIQTGKLKLLQQLEVPGVLDIKWEHVKCQDNILLGVVNSVGFLQIYKFNTENDLKIELLTEIKVREVEDEVLALSLDWSTGRNPREDVESTRITVSDSKGFVSIFHLDQGRLCRVDTLKIHEFEAWITAFDYWNTNIVYSGGDDAKFQVIDVREKIKLLGANRVHGAGVTSLHSNACIEYLLASGSYDEFLRLWDTRNIRRPISEINLGGGVWRLKWDPFGGTNRYLLAACMYGGFRIIDCKNHEKPEVIGEYNEHESIAYGCDWSSLRCDEVAKKLCLDPGQKPIFIATCSFYDHTLKLSQINLVE